MQQCHPHHLPPSSPAAIGHADAANHQDGHAGYSDPLDEQRFLVDILNALQNSPYWRSTAVVIAYDDSDGWYDHQPSPIVNPSQSPHDALKRTRRLRIECHTTRGLPTPLRVRAAATTIGDLPVRQTQLRRPHRHRPELDPALY
jgi:phospholipase C